MDVEKGERMFCTTKETVSDITNQYGYDDDCCLTRVFKL